MDHRMRLSNYLSNLEVELITAHHNVCAPDWSDMDYTPDYSKFYFICEGEGWLKIGDQEYYPQPGELFLMPEGTHQSYSVISDRPFEKYWCHFTAHVGGINLFKLLDLNPRCMPVQSERLAQVFGELVEYANSDTIYAKLLAKSKLMELIVCYLMSLNVEQEPVVLRTHASADRLTQVLDYIDDHFAENITVEALADRAYMHPNSFIRVFKQYAGMPPIQYVTHKKMEKAKQLLATTSHSISEVAQQLGFNDTFYFSKQFKKHAGLSPSDYRRQRLGDSQKRIESAKNESSASIEGINA
ncbi:AraC family transcriptional regulator [Saccharibacillus sp. O16]|nr:AraC family transcriptional regulator [Saccharibacillus sp. O16]